MVTQSILYILIVFVGTGGELCVSRAMKTIGEVTDFRPGAIARSRYRACSGEHPSFKGARPRG